MNEPGRSFLAALESQLLRHTVAAVAVGFQGGTGPVQPFEGQSSKPVAARILRVGLDHPCAEPEDLPEVA